MACFVNVVIPPIPDPLTYEVPDQLSTQIIIGARVEVPLARRKATGFVVSLPRTLDRHALGFEVKPITAIKAPYPFFSKELLTLFEWAAEYYNDYLSNVVDVALPPWVVQKFKRSVSLAHAPIQTLRGKLGQRLIDFLQSEKKSVDYSALLRKFPGAGPVVKRLCNQGLLQIETKELFEPCLFNEPVPNWAKKSVSLNVAQENASEQILSAINKNIFTPFLLYGVTGSGKTEVYIEVIRKTLELGKGALIIVPEIALTPQLIDRFRARLGDNIAVLHSALQRRSRWEAWRALLEKKSLLAIGARSGIFAPVHNLGLIIVDEEHDSSYKQAESLRYHARDLAVVRARMHNCPVVLGSATPSLESLHNTFSKKYHLLTLPSRPENMAQISLDLINLNQLRPWEMASKNVSPQLCSLIKETLARHEQAFILYNRRGFASFLQCNRCDAVMNCPNCSVSLTYHKYNHLLLCHYCNYNCVPPKFCIKCDEAWRKNSEKLQQTEDPRKFVGELVERGAGTEKVFDELKQLFPEAKIARLDRDAANDTEAYRRILSQVRSAETDILVGTQMIAKGHDLPGVTLVGVVDCDVGLHMPDFRAGERVFQLLTQASGRAGRGNRPGQVILQTRVPQHPSLIHTVNRDFLGFAKEEIKKREALGYPPFKKLLRILVSSSTKELPKEILDNYKKELEVAAHKQAWGLQLLGPVPAPIQKLRSMWRWHLLLKAKSSKELVLAVKRLRALKSKTKKARVVFDIDPQDMM